MSRPKAKKIPSFTSPPSSFAEETGESEHPHCDERVLHAPSTCRYCDRYPKRQAERIALGINFTGETRSDRAPCPATLFRPLDRIHQWYGNTPRPK